MNIKDLKPLSNEQCQAINGGFWPAVFMGASLLLSTLPLIKSMWNAHSGSFSLPAGVSAKWGEEKIPAKKHSGKELDFKQEIEDLQNKIQHLIPPFYEF